MKNDNFEILIKNFKIFVMILWTFDNREINFEIDNKVEKSIETKDETVSISKIFILNFDNSILMFKKIVEIARAAHQSTSIEKEKKLNLKKQFDNVCQQNDNYQQIKNALIIEHSRRIKNFFLAECIFVNEHVYYREDRKLIFDDNELRLRLIKFVHNTFFANHSNVVKCYEILARNYFWIDMSQDVKKYIRNCYICMKIKYFQNRYNKKLKFLSMSKRRWIDIFIDFVMTLFFSKNLWDVKCKNIMIVVDRLFKNVYYESIDDLIFVEIVKIYYINIWKHIDLFNIIVSNRDIQFVNDFWNELCKRLNITVFLFTAYHSQIDDQIEIVNAIMKQYF